MTEETITPLAVTAINSPEDLEDFFASLDAVISKANSKSRLEAEAKKAKSRLLDRRAAPETKLLARQDLAEINAQIEAMRWRVEATVALFSQQSCDNCGSTHRFFLQHMQRQVTVNGAKVQRWVRTFGICPDVQREVIVQPSKTHICADCCGEFDFELTTAEIKFADRSEPFAVSQAYIQEDPNGESI